MNNASSNSSERALAVQELWRMRPRSPLLRWTVSLFALWTMYSWLSGEIGLAAFLSERRIANLRGFFANEVMPFPLRGEPFQLSTLQHWVSETWTSVGAQGTLATLQISILAISLAGLGAWPLALLSARNFATDAPFESSSHKRSLWPRLAWTIVRRSSRFLAILLRAVPEYILAFLLLSVLGSGTAWPAILALALHNGGILSRLGGEVVENLEPAPMEALRACGARRSGLFLFGVLPLSLGRNLLYFFYRFETCVREATVLGMLGVVSLGYWIQDARSKQYYDQVLLLMLFGVGLVLLADLVSAIARRSIRRS